MGRRFEGFIKGTPRCPGDAGDGEGAGTTGETGVVGKISEPDRISVEETGELQVEEGGFEVHGVW